MNKYHRAHDVPNLFIVDGSSFVTGGRNHPTMTISALAFRAADHLVQGGQNRQRHHLGAAGAIFVPVFLG